MVMTHSSSVDRISEFIAQINSEKPNTVRQRLCIVVSKLKSKKGNMHNRNRCNYLFCTLAKMDIKLVATRFSLLTFSYRCY